MAFSFKKHSLFRVGKWDDLYGDTAAVMVSYDKLSDRVFIKRYQHSSDEGSDEAVLAGYLESDPVSNMFIDIQWDWVGKASAFAELARQKADMKIPERRMHPDDFDREVVAEMYKRFYQWYECGKPAWKDKIFRLKSKKQERD